LDFGGFYIVSRGNAAAQTEQRVHLDGGVQPLMVVQSNA
jgi:hypothetical protein